MHALFTLGGRFRVALPFVIVLHVSACKRARVCVCMCVFVCICVCPADSPMCLCMQEAREYDGGKYAALLLRQSASPGLLKGTLQPVSAATLNFTGSTAQLHLLATLPEERGKGYATTLLSSIEGLASTLGMEEIVTQPRRKMLSKYVEDFGYSVATPLEALVLHRSVPLAYYDCVVVRKSLAV